MPKTPGRAELTVENGPTHVSLDGTLQDPVAFQGADVRLKFSGPDMGLLEPLVGFPIPKTAAYQLSGKLDVDGLDKILASPIFRGASGTQTSPARSRCSRVEPRSKAWLSLW